jgi:hypothetical protein
VSKRKEGNVVLLLPALPHEGVQFLQENVTKWPLLSVLGDERLKTGKAEHLTLGVVGLNEAVSVEEGAVAFLEYYLLLLKPLTALDGPQDEPGGRVHFCCESTGGPPPGPLYASRRR